jgi:LCP family protein required for cell wall assembly
VGYPGSLSEAPTGAFFTSLGTLRTTIKRGIGRGGSPVGDGRVFLPPDALTPATRYRQPQKRARGTRLVGKVVLWALAVVVMLAGAIAGGAVIYYQREVVAQVQVRSKSTKAAVPSLDVPLPGHPAIALVIGYDKRPGEVVARSDTIMLIRAQPHPKAISLLSFPRDLKVPIYCHRHEVLTVDKINQAYQRCKETGTLETIRALTGLPINYIITVNFNGFRKLVDSLGGVWLDVDRRYFHSNAGLPTYETYEEIDLQPGYQKLNGNDALDFVRYRHSDNDFVRGARQQEFVEAVKEQISKEISGSAVLTQLPKDVSAITQSVEIGQGGGHDVPGRTILSYALFAYRLPAGRLFRVKINGLLGYSYVTTSPENITDAVRDFQNPDVEAPKKAGSRALGKKLRTHGAPPPQRTTVTLLNGNNVEGSAGKAAYQLQLRGYKIVFPPNGLPANAPRFDYFRTQVYFDRRKPKARYAATKIANLFGSADTAPMAPEIRPLSNGSMVVVTVGQTFHGRLAPSPIDHTPPKQPPVVRRDPSATLRMLKARKRSVPFTLEVPTVIERSSTPDPAKPIRRYRIDDGQKAVRLAFRMGDGIEYWGVEETAWEDAPALEDGEHHRIKGRNYDFYWNGSHLHMVVLRQNDATYWVINTLQDTLSNETMVAIAKGLRPLPLHHPAKKHKRKKR